MEAVAEGRFAAGLLIHEGQLTHGSLGLLKLVDLGEWWEEESGLPIPLGGIIALRTLGVDTLHTVETALRESVRHARQQPAASAEYVRQHAQELADDVIRAHIGLYVNDFSENLGSQGLEAVRAIFKAAEERGILTPFAGPITLGG
jgi:1,4-dihydroxy-6-naphthoate synthase